VLGNCKLSRNSAAEGGGAFTCVLQNCLLTDNTASGTGGGGAVGGTLNNCTLVGNSATGLMYGGGGAYGSELNNCILYYNSARSGEPIILLIAPVSG